MTITIDGTNGITTPGLTNSGPLAGTTGTFSGLISANGGQIKFPATQSASSDANTLDDYEEGNFTPSFISTGTQPSYTPYNTYGTYIKIGKMVYVSIHVQASAVASQGTGTMYISGLPFTSSNPPGNAGYQALAVGYSANFLSNQSPVGSLVFQNSQAVYLYYLPTLGSNKTDVTTAALTANTEIYIAGCYQTAN